MVAAMQLIGSLMAVGLAATAVSWYVCVWHLDRLQELVNPIG